MSPGPEHDADQLPEACADCLARSSCIFISLPAEYLEQAQQITQVQHFAPRCTVHRQGARARGLFIVRSGFLRLLHLDAEGRETAVGFARPSALLGLTEVITASPYLLTAVTAVESELEFIPRSRFVPFLLETPQLTLSLLMRMSEDYQDTLKKLCETTTRSRPSRRRLLDTLQSLAETCGRPVSDGAVLPASISVQDLAAHLGLSRQWTSKVLQELIKNGQVRRDGRCLVLRETE